MSTTNAPQHLPVLAEPMHSPAQILEFVNRFMNQIGLPPQRESFIKLNAMSTNSKRSPQKSVPWLSLRGTWLQKAGFVEYKYAQTIAFKGLLIVIPGINPPVATDRDIQNLIALANKLARHVHSQK